MNSVVRLFPVVALRININLFKKIKEIAFLKRDFTCSSSFFIADLSANTEKSKKKSKLPDNWGSKKAHRKVKLHFIMADPKTEEILAPLRFLVKEQVNESYEHSYK